MRPGAGSRGCENLWMNLDWARKQAFRLAGREGPLHCLCTRGRIEPGGLARKTFARDPHRLIVGARFPDQGAEGFESKVSIEPERPGRPRDYGVLVAVLTADSGQLAHQAGQDAAVSISRAYGKQANLARRTVRRQVSVEVGEFLIERERAPRAQRDHSNDVFLVLADHVLVFSVEPVDQPAVIAHRVLRYLRRERLMVQAKDLLELVDPGGSSKP